MECKAPFLTNSPMEQSFPDTRLALTALLVSLGGGFNFGYQLLITNPAQEAFLQFLNSSLISEGSQFTRPELEARWGIIISLFFWGATAGAFFIKTVAEKLGRRRGMALTFFAQAISMGLAVASYFKNAWIMYSISRAVLGAAISISLGIAPLFITECSPISCRGVISLATGVMMQLALTIGAIVAIPQLWGTVDDWWKMYAVEGVMTLIISILCFFIHESPSFLVYINDLEAAKNSFIFYHNIEEKAAADLVQDLTENKSSEPSYGLIEVLKDSTSRRPTLVGCVVMGGMILSGIAAINAFAYDILITVGLSSFGAAIANILICAMTVVGVLASSTVIDRWGRRPLLLATFMFLAGANVVITALMLIFQQTGENFLGWALVATICLFNFVFCLGPGPLAFFITGELVGQEARGAACTWVNVVLNGLRSILLIVYFPLTAIIGGPFTYLALFLPPCLLAAILLYFYLPETKGRSPEEAADSTKNLPRIR